MSLNALDWDLIDGYTETVATFTSTVFGQILSWPVAVVAIGLIFYRPIAELIGRIESGEAPGVKFKVRATIRQAEVASIDSVIEEADSPQGDSTDTSSEVQAEKQTDAMPDATRSATPPAPKTDFDDEVREFQLKHAWQRAYRQGLNTVDDGLFSAAEVESRPMNYPSPGELTTRVLNAYERLESSLGALFLLVHPGLSGRVPPHLMARRLMRARQINGAFVESFDKLSDARNAIASGAKIARADVYDFERTARRLRLILEGKFAEIKMQHAADQSQPPLDMPDAERDQ